MKICLWTFCILVRINVCGVPLVSTTLVAANIVAFICC
jgi:hypothetical protein